MTDHSALIADLRRAPDHLDWLLADLLEMHDQAAISLDNWPAARAVIEARTGALPAPNGA